MITTERFRQRLYEAAVIDHANLRRWLTETGIGVGVAQTILPKEMNGRDSIPSAEKLAAIAAITGRSIDWLLGLDELSLGEMHAAHAAAGGQAGDFTYVPRRDGPKTALSLAIGLPREWIEERLRANPRDVVAATVTDDAMAPTLHRGDMVLVDCSLNAAPDGLYLIDVRGGVMIRRLQQIGERVHLLCDDKRFPTLEARTPDITMTLYEPGQATENRLGYIVGQVIGLVSALR